MPSRPKIRIFKGDKVAFIMRNKVVITILEAMSKVDSELSSMTPTMIELETFSESIMMTAVFDTPNSNSRLLAVYHLKTQKAQVIDYTKIPKNVQGHQMVETTN